MLNFIKTLAVLYAILLVQITILPTYMADPFQPNLLILMIVYLGLREGGAWGALRAFVIGLIADCFSGHYLGLSAFAFLSIHLLLRKVADRLYTDSLYLMVLVVFLATLLHGSIHLLLLMFSVTNGIYATLLTGLLPQALINALAASLLTCIPSLRLREEQ